MQKGTFERLITKTINKWVYFIRRRKLQMKDETLVLITVVVNVSVG